MDQILALVNVVIGWLPEALAVIGAFALIATKTPNKVDDKIGQVLMDIVNFLGANFGKAKNDPSK